MVAPGDIVVFEPVVERISESGLIRTPSNYGRPNLELLPTPGNLYVMCQDKSFQRWPPDGEALGWEYVTVNNTPHVRVAQFGFQPVEMIVKIIDKTRPIPEGYGTIGNHIEFSTYGTINEQLDDGEPSENSVLSGPPPPVTRRHTTQW
jgi:hypothetical protein